MHTLYIKHSTNNIFNL